MIFSEFTELCNHLHNPVLEHFHYSQKDPFSSLTVSSLPRPQPQAALICFLSIHLPFVDILYKWNDTASFTGHNVFEAYPCCNMYVFFLFIA